MPVIPPTKVEAGGSELQGYLWLLTKAILGYADPVEED